MGFEDYVIVIFQCEFPEIDGFIVALKRHIFVCTNEVINYAGVIWHCVRKSLGGKQAPLCLQHSCESESIAQQSRIGFSR